MVGGSVPQVVLLETPGTSLLSADVAAFYFLKVFFWDIIVILFVA